MNPERVFKVLLGPHISEKATVVAEKHNQVVFRVASDATKPEIKAAVEQLFNVKVDAVQVSNLKGKRKRTRYGMGKRSDLRKAYVRLQEGQDIDFLSVEKA
ncbi:MAG: 50S ribosomal protein L23 [Pseudomonadales bacterium]|nr:50S ribosomal protein L23 [Pseudomonadales bacterium]